MAKPWLFVLGTRPEAVKLAPLVREFLRRDLPCEVCFTGQHDTLFADSGFLSEFRVSTLGVGSANDPLAYVQAALKALGTSLEPERYRGVIVQGDTASALAGGRWARLTGLPLAHVEAGLRSGNLNDPWPEERFRLELDRASRWLFAPTLLAELNLRYGLGSKLRRAGLWTVGNTGVDALLASGVRPARIGERTSTVLITLHRRESFGEPLAQIASGLLEVAQVHQGLTFIWPVHPNPRVRSLADQLRLPPNVRLVPPMGYGEFVHTLARATAVLTDSGGVVEEAATLGTPCAIARDRTERAEALQAGVAKLAHRCADTVTTALRWAISAHIEPTNVFGDGHASERIATVLRES